MMGMRWAHKLLWLVAATWTGNVGAVTDENGVRRIPLRSHTLTQPYLDSDMQSRFFEFGEDTIVRADQYIRLTSDLQGQSGWVFSRLPITATNWEVEVEFKMHGRGHLHGDGMAIWFTEQRAETGDVFGFRNNFNGLGIFIDTYRNGRNGVVFPYVMAMVSNGTEPYNKDTDGESTELAGCSARGLRTDDVATKMRITYYQDQYFRVDLHYKGQDEWTECFETNPFKLPLTYYLGFTAETGELTDRYDIISVNTHNLYIRQHELPPGMGMPNTNKENKPAAAKVYNPGGEKDRGSWRWFFLKIILLGVVVVGGYVGWTIYRSSKRASRF